MEKDRKRRLDSAATARLEIDEAITAPATGEGVAPVVLAAPRWRRVLPWAVAAVALGVGLALVLLLWAPWRPAATAGAAAGERRARRRRLAGHRGWRRRAGR